MKSGTSLAFAAAAALLITAGTVQAKPQIYPVGTVQYDPAKAYNSYVIMTSSGTAKMVDRNGNLVREWDTMGGASQPVKALPGGYVITDLYRRLPSGYQDGNTVAILDFDGKIVRKFNRHEKVDEIPGTPKDANGETWVARQHHEVQIEGMSTGYYAPGQTPRLDGKMLILTHENNKHPGINQNVLLDDAILIVDKDENIVWKWNASDHFEELGYTKAALAKTREKTLGRKPLAHQGIDWLHINCASWLGPNKWYDAGDERFHPDNIICDSRNTSHMFIIDHKTGKIVWQVAPPFVGEDGQLGSFSGVHGTHMIPKGLPGEGNILVFDNGGTMSDNMYVDQNRAWSRVVEFDPVTKKKVWEYSGTAMGFSEQKSDNFFFSQNISIAQRLPNGNTLITEGSCSRIIEVTPQRDIVWEYVSPYDANTYRAYAVPYDFFPQLEKPREVSVTPPMYGAIVMPNDEGTLPNYQPVIDKRKNVQFGTPAPVLTPALAKKMSEKK